MLRIICFSVTILFMFSFKNVEMKNDNPLLLKFETPFGVPPFELIKNEDYKPAVIAGIAQQQSEVDEICKKTESPTFENTIEALEYSGELLNTVNTIFSNINSANTSESIQEISKEIAPMLSKQHDDIMLNKTLFNRVKSVYDKRLSLKLSGEQLKLTEETYKDFIRGGAALSNEAQDEIREINTKLSVLTLRFGQNLLAETNSFKLEIDNKKDLSGLPHGIIDAAYSKETGKWVFTLQNPSVMPFLQYAANRNLRYKIWDAYQRRGNNSNEKDNKDLILEIIKLRYKKAQLLGYKNHAAYVLEKNMAETPEKVYTLLNQLWAPAINRAKSELTDIQNLINSEKGDFKAEPWDWRYYAEKVRKEKYNLDEELLRPYFKLENVRDGIFYLAQKLYGITFEELKNFPKYHPDVVAYEVKNADGSHRAVLYMDFFPRDSKRAGAWMTSYRKQSRKNGENISPVISIVCNFSKPSATSPSLLTIDEVQTFFHEFGHAIHGMLSNCTYNSLSGTAVPRDFVELPSQIMENWAMEPEVMKLYARNFQTGNVIPDSLINKLEISKYFNQGFATVEYLAASYLDMGFHDLTDTTNLSVETIEKNTFQKLGLLPEIISRYRSTYFNHIFAGGYSAGYYSYIWAEVLDADAFDYFMQKGIFDSATARSFRENILERGGTGIPSEMYKKFRGSDPQISPLLKRRGLK